MGFFSNIFGKKEPSRYQAKVLVTRSVLNHLLAEHIRSGNTMVVVFFHSTQHMIEKELNDLSLQNKIIHADQISEGMGLPSIRQLLSVPGNAVILGERFPLKAYENEIADRISSTGATLPLDAFGALDDAFFLHFGGERIASMMKSMGMKDDEIIEHSMIEKSIENAQDKIAKKVLVTSKANSPEDWFRLHIQQPL
ncbi:MAG: hypothetical protein Fur0041_13050 [Bacteroidia bacterium]